jgi:Kef-type K+ transport system membrane component KefB
VNATSGLSALYVLLAGVAWTLFILFPVKMAFHYVARKTGSLESGEPTTFMMMLTFLMVFASAFFTDIIGK